MAESELSVLTRQCPHQRIPGKATLIQEIVAWTCDRNAARLTPRLTGASPRRMPGSS